MFWIGILFGFVPGVIIGMMLLAMLVVSKDKESEENEIWKNYK